MRKSIAFAVIIACLSIAYYFAISLPSTYSKTERAVKTATTSKEDLEMQEKCVKASKGFFEEQGYSNRDMANYECHYNKRLKKYFILITDTVMSGGTITTCEYLTDVLTRKEYGMYTWYNPGNKKYWEIIPTWKVLDKSGEGEEGWKEAIKPYMEE